LKGKFISVSDPRRVSSINRRRDVRVTRVETRLNAGNCRRPGVPGPFQGGRATELHASRPPRKRNTRLRALHVRILSDTLARRERIFQKTILTPVDALNGKTPTAAATAFPVVQRPADRSGVARYLSYNIRAGNRT